MNPSPITAHVPRPPRSPQAGQIARSLARNPQAAGANGTPFQGPSTDPTAGVNPVDPYDYSQDPILLKIQAGNVKARTDAHAAALAGERGLAIQLGDSSGIVDDPNTQAEAAANPYSTLATLLKSYQDTSLAHDETLNKQNLFYSGARAKTLAEDANSYQHGIYDARNQALAQRGQLEGGLAQNLSAANQSDIGAETDAQARAANQAVTNGYDPGAAWSQGAVTNQHATLPTSQLGPGVSPLAAALSKSKVANAYLTNPNKRG